MIDLAARECVNPLWQGDWLGVRRNWRLTDSVFHFSHGAFGAVPISVRNKQQALIDQIDANPTGFFRRDLELLLEAARLEAARFCGADPDGFAWIKNASEGMTIALTAIPLKPGEEVVITNHAYPAVRLAVENKCAATGAKLVEAQIPFAVDETQLIAAIEAVISKQTRVLVVDEIAAPSARLFPIRELAKITRNKDIVLVVDGAHAPGMYELSIDTLGADIWVGNFHKWVCAPHGAAAIWAAQEWRNILQPSSVGFRDRLPYPQRFSRLGTDDLTAILCVPFAINFLIEIGAEKIYRYNSELASYGADVIAKATNTPKVTGRFAARRPIALPRGTAADAASASALQTRIATELRTELSVVAPIGGEDHGFLVISAFAYNHPGEYEEFGQSLVRILQI